MDALLPLLTRLFEAGRIDEFRDVGQRLLETMLVISVPIVLVLAIYAPEICRILGARFSYSALVLRIVSYRALVSVLRGLIGQGFLTATNLVAERRNAVAKVLVLLAAMTLLLGRLFGPAGAATGAADRRFSAPGAVRSSLAQGGFAVCLEIRVALLA